MRAAPAISESSAGVDLRKTSCPQLRDVEIWSGEKLRQWLARLGRPSDGAHGTLREEVLRCFRLSEETLSATALAHNYNMACAQHPDGAKIIFLDVDGVLNIPELRSGNTSILLDNQVSLLAWLVKTGDAYIVLSSTWRFSPLHKLCLSNALAKAGIPETRLVGQTPDVAEFERTRELQEWLEAIEPKPQVWVAIDDLDLLSDNPEYMDGHFVLVDPSFGLDSYCAAEAARLLQSEEVVPYSRWTRLFFRLCFCFGTQTPGGRYRKNLAAVVPMEPTDDLRS